MKKTALVAALALLLTGPAQAASSDGGGAYSKLEVFAVNTAGLDHYLQVAITLKTAGDKANEFVKDYMPMIRHELILLLSSQAAADLGTPDGKLRLMEAAKTRINKVIGLDEERGVKGVLFESFVIQ